MGCLDFIGSIFKSGADVTAAGISASAAKDAANTSASAAKYEADQQTKANEETLAFEKQQAEAAYQSGESTRRANYDQWAAHEGTIASAAAKYGITRNIPAYVPGVDPMLNGTINGATGTTPTGTTQSAAIDPSKGDLASQISGFFKSKGVSDAETPYWVSKWPELVARGQQVGDPNYAMTRLSQADVFGGGAPGSMTAATSKPLPFAPPPSGTLNSYLPRI